MIFHIDYLMITHLQPQIETEHVKLLDGTYDSYDPLTFARGKVHQCLGITLNFGLKRGVTFSQCDFIKKFWLDLPQELRGPYRNAPTPENFLKVDKNASLVDAKNK